MCKARDAFSFSLSGLLILITFSTTEKMYFLLQLLANLINGNLRLLKWVHSS